MVLGVKRLGYGGETTRVENRGETTRGKGLGGETSCYQHKDGLTCIHKEGLGEPARRPV